MPFLSETIHIQDLTLYIKKELNSIQQTLSDSNLQALAKSIHQQIDKQSQAFYLLRLILNESYFTYLSAHRKQFSIHNLTIDELLNAYIGKNKFTSNISLIVFIY